MDDAQFQPYWELFEREARPVLAQLRQEINRLHPQMRLSGIEAVDRDVDQGLQFMVERAPAGAPTAEGAYVEFMLVDGEERGFEGVGVRLECTTLLSGVIYAPYNYTHEVGTFDLSELRSRVRDLPAPAAAAAILSAWREDRAQQDQSQRRERGDLLT